MIPAYPDSDWGDHTVALVLMKDRFSAVERVTVGGNCRGLNAIDAALDDLEHRLRANRLILTDDAGGRMLLRAPDEPGEGWLRDLVVSATILSFTDADG